MKIILNPKNINGGHAIALGNFDGFHLGHKAIISKMLEVARKNRLVPSIITFEPHPIQIFKPSIKPVRINDIHLKMKLLEKAGVEICYVMKFNRRFSKMTAAEFINNYLRGNNVVTGFNFAFGNNREGTTKMLKQELGKAYYCVQPVEEAGSVYSSSMVRMALKAGEIGMANKILGYDYTLAGKVLSGAQKGRQIGFPTANIKLKPDVLRPRYGVYAVNTNFGRGIANLGVRPTVDGKTELLEVHIFDFNGDIYGKTLNVEFLSFIRPEKEYKTFDELKRQIEIDCQKAKDL